jgi:transcriptional regulator with XRE-family HTH domain
MTSQFSSKDRILVASWSQAGHPMRVGTIYVDGKKVRQLRSRKGWTQEDLARHTGCSKKTIENAEAGRPVLLYTVSCLAKAFQLEHEVLLLPEAAPAPRPDKDVAPSPFSWRTAIRQAEAFFDRDHEQATVRKYLQDRQCCQVVGPRRIGKSSLLRQVERMARVWDENAVVAYLDLQDPRCFTLTGWVDHAARQFGMSMPGGADLVNFSEGLDDLLSAGRQPILCLDEFEELTYRRHEFTRDFFAALRSCGQKPISILTASQKRLRELTDGADPSSPFYNIFPPLELGPFAAADAEDFVHLERPGVPSFSRTEKKRILEFAQGHPLALQVACFQVLRAKETGASVETALAAARAEMGGYLSSEQTATRSADIDVCI